MIDCLGLGRNALWVVGLAVGLAALSMASYQARVEGIPLGHQLNKSAFQLPVAIGLAMFCLGLLFSGHSWWEKGFWGCLTALFVGVAIQRARQGRRTG